MELASASDVMIDLYNLGLVDIGIGCWLMLNYFSINISFTIVKLKKYQLANYMCARMFEFAHLL